MGTTRITGFLRTVSHAGTLILNRAKSALGARSPTAVAHDE